MVNACRPSPRRTGIPPPLRCSGPAPGFRSGAGAFGVVWFLAFFCGLVGPGCLAVGGLSGARVLGAGVRSLVGWGFWSVGASVAGSFAFVGACGGCFRFSGWSRCVCRRWVGCVSWFLGHAACWCACGSAGGRVSVPSRVSLWCALGVLFCAAWFPFVAVLGALVWSCAGSGPVWGLGWRWVSGG